MDEQYGQLIEPQPVPFSFGAPGWYVAGIILLLLLAFMAGLIWRNYKRNAYRRQALSWLHRQKANADKSNLLYDTNMLLKRIAFSKYGRGRVAAMRGSEWIGLLNGSLHAGLFNEKDRELLQTCLYAGKEQNTDSRGVDDFVHKAELWIRKHHKNIRLSDAKK